MPRYDEAFVDRFLAPWNRHDVDGALALMTDDCVWEIPRGREPHDAQLVGCSTHPVDGAVGFRTAHRQWLATFSHDLAREVVMRGFHQLRRHHGDAQCD
jgi:ketosteroid isomerase-like protein